MRHSPFLPTPALPPGRKVRLRLSPHFSAFRQPFGLKHNRYVPPTMPAAWGSSVRRMVDNANVAVPLPRQQSCPHAEEPDSSSRPSACKCSADKRLHDPSRSFYSRGTPGPGSPGPHVSCFRSKILSIKHAANPSPIACTENAEGIFRASPGGRARFASRGTGPPSTIHDRSTVPVDALSGRTTAAAIAAAGPDPAKTPESALRG